MTTRSEQPISRSREELISIIRGYTTTLTDIDVGMLVDTILRGEPLELCDQHSTLPLDQLHDWELRCGLPAGHTGRHSAIAPTVRWRERQPQPSLEG